MSEPKIITDTLAQLEAAERDPRHPRSLARQAVAKWRSNAEREMLPVTNQHDIHEAPVLNTDAILDHNHHNQRLGRK